MRKTFVLLLLVSLGISAGAQNPKTFSLNEAIQYAMEHSFAVKNAQIGVADAGERINENRAFGLPQVNATVNYQYFVELPVSLVPAEFFGGNPGEFAEVAFGTSNNLTASLELRSMVFDWSYFTALEAARAYRRFSKEQLVQTGVEVANQVRSAYLPPLILDESRKTLVKNISNLEKLFSETQALYKEGFVEQLDVDRLELSLANLQTELDNIDRQKVLALNVLKFTIGYPIQDEIAISDDIEKLLEPATDQDLNNPITFQNRAEYRVAELGKNLNELNISYLKSGYYPSLSAFGQYQQVAQGNNLFKNPVWTDVGVIGLQLNVPIFDGLQKKAKIHRARLDMEKTQNQINELERVITMEVSNARIAYRNAQVRLENQEKNKTLAQKIYDTTQIKYKEGVGSSLEIVNAEQSLFQAQQNYIQARYELLQAKVALDKALGK